MELKDTVEMMVSKDFKERFRAEYYQLKIRYEKLSDICKKWDNDELEFTPMCPRDIFDQQLDYMYNYMKLLETRAHLERIEL